MAFGLKDITITLHLQPKSYSNLHAPLAVLAHEYKSPLIFGHNDRALINSCFTALAHNGMYLDSCLFSKSYHSNCRCFSVSFHKICHSHLSCSGIFVNYNFIDFSSHYFDKDSPGEKTVFLLYSVMDLGLLTMLSFTCKGHPGCLNIGSSTRGLLFPLL